MHSAKDMLYVTEDMQSRIMAMADRTYQFIGSDLERSRRAIGKRANVSQKEFIDRFMEVDYMMVYGEDEEAYWFWQRLSFYQKYELMKKAFPHEWYE